MTQWLKFETTDIDPQERLVEFISRVVNNAAEAECDEIGFDMTARINDRKVLLEFKVTVRGLLDVPRNS